MFRVSLAITLALVLGAALYDSSGEYAEAKCNPNRTAFSGTILNGLRRVPGGTVGGVYATIRNYSPYVYPSYPAPAAVLAWVAVSTETKSDTAGAQVGWLEFPYDPAHGKYGERRTFAQWTRSGQFRPVQLFPSEPLDSYPYYTTLFNNTPSQFTFYKNGVKLPLTETAYVTFTPDEGLLMGEVTSTGSQMPGGYNNLEYLSDAHIYRSASWGDFDEAYNATYDNPIPSWYGAVRFSSTGLAIWDKACSS